MLGLGLDSASKVSGICLLKDDKPIEITHYASNTKLSLPQRLLDFQKHIGSYFPVDYLAIEKVSVRRNLNTVRKLAYFESAAILVAAKFKTPVFQFSPSVARKIALGNGKLTKEEIYNLYSKEYNLSPFKKGGHDESDAICLAFAGAKEFNA